MDLDGDARPLADEEVEALQPTVAGFIQKLGIGMDWGLTHANKNRQESTIWLFEDEEAAILARAYLRRARYIGWMAQTARQVEHIVEAGQDVAVARILGKRIIASPVFIATNGGLGLWLSKNPLS